MTMQSSLSAHHESLLSLYSQGLGAPEIQVQLNLSVTPRSIQRYLKKHGVIRTTKDALALSEPRRISTIQGKWIDHKKVRRKVLSPKRRYQVFKLDHFACTLCGITAADGARLEIDHVLPIHLGGTNETPNLRTLCYDCNVGRYHDVDPVYKPHK